MRNAAFLPIFEKYMAPAFEELLSEKAPDALLWNGLCVYVDVIEVSLQSFARFAVWR
jgi:hypothetical protein